MRFSWRHDVSGTVAALLVVVVVGLLSGHLVLSLLVGLFAYIGWHLRSMVRLLRWLADGMHAEPPVLHGVWDDLLGYLIALRVRARKRKRKMSRFLRRFQEAAAALPDAALIFGRFGEIEWCNPAARHLLGLGAGRVAGHYFTHLVRHPALTQYLEAGDYSQPIEIPAPVDESRLLSCQINPIGKKHQRLLIARDVTRSHLLDSVRRDFVANVSHELRTPITVLRGFLETMGDDAALDCPDWSRSIELMSQQASRMERIVNDLLMLSRLELEVPGDPGPGLEPVPVPEMLVGIIQDARMLSGEGGHVFTLEVNPELWLRGSAEELRSAFSNLIFNAVQHTPAGSRVSVVWRFVGDESSGQVVENGAVLTVADDGEGIPDRHLPRLTERFYRVDKARSRARGGTGLGLSIVKRIITRHRAELEVYSELGRGSRFTCRFPAAIVYRRARYHAEEPGQAEGSGAGAAGLSS